MPLLLAYCMRGRPPRELALTEQEQTELERWARRPKSAQALALRAKIILRCADGLPNNEVAEKLGVSIVMVGKWRERFRRDRLQGLSEMPLDRVRREKWAMSSSRTS